MPLYLVLNYMRPSDLWSLHVWACCVFPLGCRRNSWMMPPSVQPAVYQLHSYREKGGHPELLPAPSADESCCPRRPAVPPCLAQRAEPPWDSTAHPWPLTLHRTAGNVTWSCRNTEPPVQLACLFWRVYVHFRTPPEQPTVEKRCDGQDQQRQEWFTKYFSFWRPMPHPTRPDYVDV